jgi:hypothetical protein
MKTALVAAYPHRIHFLNAAISHVNGFGGIFSNYFNL